MNRYAIGLGSNLGDRLGYLRGAVSELSRLGREVEVSSLYETAPVGGPDQGAFLNAVVTLTYDGTPSELLRELQRIEGSAKRERKEHWGPRTLDLDIITYDGAPIRTDGLTVPHPRASEREFVLRPLADVWPDASVGAESTHVALESVEDQGVVLVSSEWLDTP